MKRTGNQSQKNNTAVASKYTAMILWILKVAVVVLVLLLIYLTLQIGRDVSDLADAKPYPYSETMESGIYDSAMDSYYNASYHIRNVPKRDVQYALFCAYTEDAFFYKAYKENGMEDEAAFLLDRMKQTRAQITTYAAQADEIAEIFRITEQGAQ